jgi:2-polyprenyl-3-methyl-5-hydroxy-6-metoxy-1,4-benzoquinol methylase
VVNKLEKEEVIMKAEEKKDFDKEAAAWDENPGRVKLANDVADAIIREAQPSSTMDALDYGCGTGLVTLRLQPLVKSIVGADSSTGMLGMLKLKTEKQQVTNVQTRLVDFEHGGTLAGKFHLIVSSMTLHHVQDTAQLFKQWYELLLPGGVLAVADLDTEDGSFHGDNTGVRHLGFDRRHLGALLRKAGFSSVRDTTAATMVREVAGGGSRSFPVFLLIAGK